MVVNDNNTSFSCDYDVLQLKIAVGVRCGVSCVSCVCLLLMLYFLVILDKYKHFTQRLILYLVIASFFNSLSGALNVNGLSAYKNSTQTVYCIIVGFITQITTWWEITATTCILFNVFIQAVFEKDTHRLEHLYRFLIFFSPFLIDWVPFVFNLYGPSGEFCWIRNVDFDDPDCNVLPLAEILGYALYGVPFFINVMGLILMLLVALIFVKRKQKMWKGKYDPKSVMLQNMVETEIKPLIFYPMAFLIINVLPFVKRLYELKSSRDEVYYVLTILSSFVSSFQGAIITIIFISDIRKPVNWRKVYYMTFCRGCCRGFHHINNQVYEYPVGPGVSDSATSCVKLETPYEEGGSLIT